MMYATGNGVARDPAEAVRWYRAAAERGNADAQNDLAVMYDAGDGVAEDDAEAVRWYRRASAAGNPSAQYNLGLMYANGEGVARDRTRAYVWLSVATITSGGTTDRSALERVAASLAAPSREAADRLVATCRETNFAECGEPALP
jgi:alpha/beta superfamily hydrolase